MAKKIFALVMVIGALGVIGCSKPADDTTAPATTATTTAGAPAATTTASTPAATTTATTTG